MERSYESAAALVGRGIGPLSEHLGPFVCSTDPAAVRAGRYLRQALHAMALDRWLATHHVALADLTEAHIVRFERRRRRCRGGVRVQARRAERRDVIGLLRYLRRSSACRAERISTRPMILLPPMNSTFVASGLGDLVDRALWQRRAPVPRQRFGRDGVDLHTLRAH